METSSSTAALMLFKGLRSADATTCGRAEKTQRGRRGQFQLHEMEQEGEEGGGGRAAEWQ